MLDTERLAQIDLLKINVEKSELRVLRGMESSHWARVRQVVLEVDVAADRDDVVAILRDAGFRVTIDQDERLSGTDLHYVYAHRPGDAADDRPSTAITLPPAPLLGEELATWLAQRLPPYAVPAVTLTTDRLPLARNGKVDRVALEELIDRVGRRRQGPAARTDTERRLQRLWSETLGFPCAVDDDFFERGGTSLQAMRLLGEVSHQFGVRVRGAEFLTHRTVTALAGLLDARPRQRPAGSESVGTRQ